jgi:hypothetical protein
MLKTDTMVTQLISEIFFPKKTGHHPLLGRMLPHFLSFTFFLTGLLKKSHFKYAVEMASGGTIHMPSFMTISSDIQANIKSIA